MPRKAQGQTAMKEEADMLQHHGKARKLSHGGGPSAAKGGAIPIVHDDADIKELEERRRQTLEQLRNVETTIYNLETQYFDMANTQGNALKGYDGLLSSAAVSAKKAAFKDSDRHFSGSSTTGTNHLHLPGL